jgi:homoserine dehydrogenase
MPHYKLALLGFGNVGRALARLLMRKQSDLKTLYDIDFSITGIATGRHGMAVNPDGIDVDSALTAVEGGSGSLDNLTALSQVKDAFDFIRQSEADVLFENTPVNYQTAQPALDHIRFALESGMHCITANKGPVVHAYQDLSELARRKGIKFYFEATVMDGAPIFSLFRETLPAARLQGLYGILNSTTNLILSRMEAGESFDEAVAYAQSIGIAETDPSGDIDGWDAAIKVSALVSVMMGVPMQPDQVDRTGIRGISLEDLERARQEGKRWKLVCSARQEAGVVKAKVAPEMVPPSSPLYSIEGTTSIVQFETDVLGLLSVVESDPGPETTAYGLLADFINAVRS